MSIHQPKRLEEVEEIKYNHWGSIECISDTEKFVEKIKLEYVRLEDTVQIIDGEYNAVWKVIKIYHLDGICALIPYNKDLGASVMNEYNDTEGGYTESFFNRVVIPYKISILEKVLGNYMVNRPDAEYVRDIGNPKMHLLSKEGIIEYGLFKDKNFNEVLDWTISWLPLWLRSVVSSTYFAFANNNGYINFNNASDSFGVRPLIFIG